MINTEKFDLLYKIKEQSAECEFLYEFSIDKIIGMITPDIKTQKYMLDIFSYPLIEKENIIYRREIIKDFVKYPNLLIKLIGIFSEFDKLAEEIKNSKILFFKMKSVSKYDEGVVSIEESHELINLSLTNLYVEKIIRYIENLNNEFLLYDLKSFGLLSLKNYCCSLVNSEEYKKLKNIVSNIEKLSLLTCSFNISLEVDENLNAKKAKLNDIIHKNVSIFENENFIIDDRKKYAISMNKKSNFEINNYLKEAVNDINLVLYNIYETIFDKIKDLSKQLTFYSFSLRYYDIINKNPLNYCFAEILEKENNCIECEDLYDLYLSLYNDKKYGIFHKKVISNDVIINKEFKGILIKGDNDSGKTVFLRSIATAQLFSQIGLPINAKNAKISIRKGIYANFSSEEKFDNTLNNEAGRFENEVLKFSEIFNKIDNNSILFLNEIFQTTAYNEGTVGIYNILDYLSKMKVQWIFVTHLTELFNMFKNNNVKNVLFLSTSTEKESIYKLIKNN